MKFVEVDSVAVYLANGSGALASFVLSSAVKRGLLPPSFDYVHLLSIIVTIAGLTLCSIRKARKGTVPPWVWLTTAVGVGWLSGAWVESSLG